MFLAPFVCADGLLVGEISRLDDAAVLAAALRLGVVHGGVGTHQRPVRDRRTRQHRPGGRLWSRAELGFS